MKKLNSKFGTLEFGDKGNEAIVLLHGFPANAESLKPVAKFLASKGYYVLVPEQRGYHDRLRPKWRYNYRLSKLVEDLESLLNEMHISAAHIVGHDWGGVVAWAFASAHPKRTITLISVSTPHPKALLRSVLRSKQLLLSWYMLFFQLPWLPEWVFSRSGGRYLVRALVQSGLGVPCANNYAKRMQDKLLLKGALNWYRALPFTLFQAIKIRKIELPTLFIYGENDKFLSENAAKETGYWVGGSYTMVTLKKTSHWIPEEMPGWLGERIADFLRAKTS